MKHFAKATDIDAAIVLGVGDHGTPLLDYGAGEMPEWLALAIEQRRVTTDVDTVVVEEETVGEGDYVFVTREGDLAVLPKVVFEQLFAAATPAPAAATPSEKVDEVEG